MNTCCFFGHRKIEITDELRKKLRNVIEKLIVEENTDTFLFGCNSQFDDLCHEITSELKICYPYVKRIYVRAKFPDIDDKYKSYLLESYEETYYPDNILKAGKAAYIKRNQEMIDKSNFCIIYFNENYMVSKRNKKTLELYNKLTKSGTKIAYDYASKKEKTIINIFDEINH